LPWNFEFEYHIRKFFILCGPLYCVFYGTRIRAIADGRINSAFFDGKARNFTFEKYCEVLNNAFTDLESSGETVDESRKIRMFMQGLNDPCLQSAKDTIIANPATLGASFDSAVTYVGTVMEQQMSLAKGSRTHDVCSASTFGRGGRGRAGRGGGREHNRGSGRGGRGGGRHSNLTDRYFKPEEWEKLSYDERQTLGDKRKERDKRRNVQAVDRNVRSRQTDQSHTETSSTPASAPAPAASNTSLGVTSRRTGPSVAFRDS
jgi:hypothetical protein